MKPALPKGGRYGKQGYRPPALAKRVGFEPTGLFTPSGFQDRRLRPLGHLFVFALMHGQLSGAFNCGTVSTENEFVKVCCLLAIRHSYHSPSLADYR